MKKNRLNALLLVLCMCSVYSNQVEAKEVTSITTDDIKSFTKKYAKKGWDLILQANDYVNEYTDNFAVYKQDSLWLITDTPNVNPNEERNYYFIDTSTKGWEKTTFYNKYGNEVEKNSKDAVRKTEVQTYEYLTISGKLETFTIRYEYDLKNGTITSNFADFDTEYYWEEDIPLEYGRFVDVSEIIPEEKQKEKYSAYDLSEILEIINDPEYEIFIEPMERTIK